MAEQGDNNWTLSPIEFSSYYAYFFRLSPPGQLLSGARARDFFLQTKLPPQILSQIWGLSDLDHDGCLNPAEFAVAMHLVQVCLKDPTGHVPLPSSCPTPLELVVKQALYPQLPVATQAHLTKCRNAFGAFYENIGIGVLGGDAARYLMMKSNLSKAQLYHIWKLSDIDQDGRLTFMEFTIAMQLIFIAKLGYILPVDLDPNTILPPSFYQIITNVQTESEQAPPVTPTHTTLEPFTPPCTPGHTTTPVFFGENPFVSDAFINLPAKQFREGVYDNFTGDPFVSMDPFVDGNGHDISVDSDDFVESNPSDNYTIVKNGSNSTTPDSGVSATDSLPSDDLKQPNGHVSSSSSTPQPPVVTHLPKGPPRVDRQIQPSPVLDRSDSPQLSQSSYSHTSSKESLQLKDDRHSHGSRSPIALSLESLSSSQARLSTGGGSETNISGRGSHPDLSQQSSGSYHRSQDSLSSSPKPKENRRSGRSSNASFQEVVIVESNEPVLQVANTVDVVGSRENTPVPEQEVDTSGGRNLSPNDVTERLETLSKASRTFLVESQTKLKEQQQKAYVALAAEEYRQVSVNGLPATIREIENEPNRSQEPVKPVSNPVLPDQIPSEEDIDFNDDLTTSDVMSQFDDIEAEVMSTLDDADFDIDDFSDEDVPIDYDQVEVGALDMENPAFALPISQHREQEVKKQDPNDQITTDDLRELRTGDSGNKTPTKSVSNVSPTATEPQVSNGSVVVKRSGYTVSQARREAKRRTSQFLEAAMDDLDSYLEDELADINDMFEEFQTKDKKVEQRLQTEEKELENVQFKANSEVQVEKHVEDTAEEMEKITQRRNLESEKIAQEWEQEMQLLEAERLKTLEEQELTHHQEVESDAVIQSLDSELQALIKHEVQAVKIAQKEKELFLQREKEESERKERERKEKLEKWTAENQEELTIEEWIAWMEEKKKQGMTPEQLTEHDRRKAAWIEEKKRREEKRKREEEEQIAKTRKKMEYELRAIRERDMELRSSRLTEEELEEKRREKACVAEEESRVRKERAKQTREEMKQREMEELKPKAKSALAAKWEERIRAKSEGKVSREEHSSTVLTGNRILSRGDPRAARRISNGSRPLSTSSDEASASLTSETKRYSVA